MNLSLKNKLNFFRKENKHNFLSVYLLRGKFGFSLSDSCL
jgi:hypothetical protein